MRKSTAKKTPTTALAHKARIFLVDDHPVVRLAIRNVIDQQADLHFCGEAEDAQSAILLVPKLRPDLAILDIGLEDSSGIDLTRNLRALLPNLPVLILSTLSDEVYAETALRAGASGYVMKNEPMPTILQAIRTILAGGIYLSPTVSAHLVAQTFRGNESKANSSRPNLSGRELEVLRLTAQWKNTREIASELHISVKTVEYYRHRIKEKLRLKDAAEVMQAALKWFP